MRHIIYLNEAISLGKAWVLHKVKHLERQLMPQPEKDKALRRVSWYLGADARALTVPRAPSGAAWGTGSQPERVLTGLALLPENPFQTTSRAPARWA